MPLSSYVPIAADEQHNACYSVEIDYLLLTTICPLDSVGLIISRNSLCNPLACSATVSMMAITCTLDCQIYIKNQHPPTGALNQWLGYVNIRGITEDNISCRQITCTGRNPTLEALSAWSKLEADNNPPLSGLASPSCQHSLALILSEHICTGKR